MLHSIIGLPASVTSALGRPDPRRSPRPAATINATAISLACDGLLRGDRHLHWTLDARGLREQRVDVLLDLVLVHLQRVHQLGREDLLRSREHLLLAGRQTLLGLANRQVPYDLGEFVDVARLDLVAI